MEKMIEKFYELHLQEEQYPFGVIDKERMQKEYEAYYTLVDALSPCEKEQMLEYVNLNNERHKSELKAMYEYGFKMAINLILESVKE